jgi:hypothetical protein
VLSRFTSARVQVLDLGTIESLSELRRAPGGCDRFDGREFKARPYVTSQSAATVLPSLGVASLDEFVARSRGAARVSHRAMALLTCVVAVEISDSMVQTVRCHDIVGE